MTVVLLGAKRSDFGLGGEEDLPVRFSELWTHDYFGVRLSIHSSGGKFMGYVELEKAVEPVPLFYVSDLRIFEGHRNRGHCGRLVRYMNRFLDREQAPAIAINSIVVPQRREVYSRNGWLHVPGPDPTYLGYNLPPEIGQVTFDLIVNDICFNRHKGTRA